MTPSESRVIEYHRIDQTNAAELLVVLNKERNREHLIDHEPFDSDSISQWINDKSELNRISGCRVRAIHVDGQVAGWCGIQPDDQRYELAIVLDNRFWGVGMRVFKQTLDWARELGHTEVFIHLLSSRPRYKFLEAISEAVTETEMLGNCFTTYRISLERSMSLNIRSKGGR